MHIYPLFLRKQLIKVINYYLNHIRPQILYTVKPNIIFDCSVTQRYILNYQYRIAVSKNDTSISFIQLKTIKQYITKS